jgi:prevent-host-death family protein
VRFTNETTMDKVIQASEANRQFSRILREVAEGGTFTVTSRGRPVARIVPAAAKDNEAAKERFLDYLRQQPALEMGPFKREELYDC